MNNKKKLNDGIASEILGVEKNTKVEFKYKKEAAPEVSVREQLKTRKIDKNIFSMGLALIGIIMSLIALII